MLRQTLGDHIGPKQECTKSRKRKNGAGETLDGEICLDLDRRPNAKGAATVFQ